MISRAGTAVRDTPRLVGRVPGGGHVVAMLGMVHSLVAESELAVVLCVERNERIRLRSTKISERTKERV